MSVDSGFDNLQVEADATLDAVMEARRRRDAFCDALPTAPDVDWIMPSGSLARGTHKDPIHDVDLVCAFHAAEHPDWVAPGASAEEALEQTRDLIKDKLGFNGTEGREVRRCDIKNHSVKCFLGDPGDPDAFTVDATPAIVHHERGFWIPERHSEDWIHSDPKFLIDAVAKRHAEWPQFAKLVRVLKRWNTDHGGHMKTLVVEVLALEHLPAEARPVAIARFFTAASVAVWSPIEDPGGLCGEIQPDLDREAARGVLRAGAQDAAAAVEAERRGETRNAMCLWRKVFGPIFPEPFGGCDGGAGAGAAGAAAAVAAVPKRRIVDAPQG